MNRAKFMNSKGASKMSKHMNIFIDDQKFCGQAEKLIPVLEACGYEAQRDEQNPHPYWQQAEHLKKIIEKV